MAASLPHVPNQLVLALYGDHVGDVFACTKCGKEEPFDVDFSECGRCRTAQYCSKACQVDHWPKHKKRCPKLDDEDELKKDYHKMDGRLHRFNGYFSPMVGKILAVKFALLKLEDDSATNMTHLITLNFSELPDDARKPRLRLNSVGALAMADLPKQYKSHIKHGLRQHPPGVFVIPYICEVSFPARGRAKFAKFAKPGMTAFEANPLLDKRMPKTRAHLTMEGNAWIKVINDVAEGTREDLRRAIKENNKKNQARR